MQDDGGAPVVMSRGSVLALTGRALGPSPWFQITQESVNAFGRSVHDLHWAHNDPERAARGPFGTAIAHAHMTLSLIPHLRESILAFASGDFMFYGYNRVRFPTAVPVGARIRMSATVVQVDEIDGGEQVTLDIRIEVEGRERPGCVAQTVWRYYDIGQPDNC